MKVKYEALKELGKGVPHKDVAAWFGVPNNTLSTWKKNKANLIESYENGLGVIRVRPQTYENLNKALMKWFLMLRSENVPINEVF